MLVSVVSLAFIFGVSAGFTSAFGYGLFLWSLDLVFVTFVSTTGSEDLFTFVFLAGGSGTGLGCLAALLPLPDAGSGCGATGWSLLLIFCAFDVLSIDLDF